MGSFIGWIRERLVPAALTATGIALVVAGLLTYGSQAEATFPTPSAPPVGPSATPTLIPFPSLGPSASVGASPSPRVTTRVVVAALGIDLPVIRSPAGEQFPLCNVAEYLPSFSQPGTPGTTYLYAHARTGMFLPLLTESRINGGAAILGMLVQVYTSDDQLFLYEVTKVWRHQVSVANATAGVTGQQLVLQTSEGPRKGVPGYTGLVLIVTARPLSSGPADPAAANPTPHPLVCQ